MNTPDTKTLEGGRARSQRLLVSAARVAVAVVALSLSAGIAIPVGPVPFTLQILVLGIVVATMPAGEAVCAVASYLALGALGAPVFSGYVGGIVRLIGPSGGFLYGFLPAVAAGAALRARLERTRLPFAAAVFAALLVFIALSYFFGWAHLVVVGQMEPAAAFAIACAPFIVCDLVKAGMATGVAVSVRGARKRRAK